MNFNIKLSQKQLYIILIFCSVIIFLNCIEVMINVKDIGLYEQWMDIAQKSNGYDDKDVDYYQLYLTNNLSHFFIKIIVPMALGIYSYFVFKFTKINKIYVFTWTILLLGSLAFVVLERKFDSIFYYINIVCYIALIVTLLSLNKLIGNRGNS